MMPPMVNTIIGLTNLSVLLNHFDFMVFSKTIYFGAMECRRTGEMDRRWMSFFNTLKLQYSNAPERGSSLTFGICKKPFWGSSFGKYIHTD
jgi:hypothetical protein